MLHVITENLTASIDELRAFSSYQVMVRARYNGKLSDRSYTKATNTQAKGEFLIMRASMIIITQTLPQYYSHLLTVPDLNSLLVNAQFKNLANFSTYPG